MQGFSNELGLQRILLKRKLDFDREHRWQDLL